MERVHLLVIVSLLAAAGAAQPGETAAASSCDPASLTTQITVFCTADMPTARCCEPVVASVDLCGCLCRVFAEPWFIVGGFNVADLLALYTACVGRRRPGGAHLAAAACEGARLAPVAAPTVGRRPQPADTATSSSCDPRALAEQAQRFCAPESVTARCCEVVVASVDTGGCLCRVAETEEMPSAVISIYDMIDLYTRLRRPPPRGHGTPAKLGKAVPPIE